MNIRKMKRRAYGGKVVVFKIVSLRLSTAMLAYISKPEIRKALKAYVVKLRGKS